MRSLRTLLFCACSTTLFFGASTQLASRAAAEESGVHFAERQPGHVDVLVGSQLVAAYLYDHAQLTRPAFVNIMAPSGRPITRSFPVSQSDDKDHEWIHGGLWLSFGDINGHDYWRLKARVRHAKFLEPLQGGEKVGRFSVENEYLSTDLKAVICRERAEYVFEVLPQGLLVRANYTLRPESEPLVFADQEEMGLGVRMRSELRVRGGAGSITNSQGGKNEAEIWGKETDWLDYSGVVEDRRLGALLMASPQNSRRSWAHCRDYGVMVMNPFPHQAEANPKPAAARVAVGDTLELSYAVLYYDVPANKPVAAARIFKQVFAKPKP